MHALLEVVCVCIHTCTKNMCTANQLCGSVVTEQDLCPERFVEPGDDRRHSQFWLQIRVSPGSFFWSPLMSLLASGALTFIWLLFQSQLLRSFQKTHHWALCTLRSVLNCTTAAALLAYLWGSKDRMWAEEFSVVLLNSNCCRIIGQVAYG